MKRTLVAVAVAAFAATSANAATVYNQDGTKLDVSGSVRVMLNKKTDQRTDLQNDGSRVKFKFSQNIGEGLSALGYIELRPTKTDGDDKNFGDGITTNKLYAGLKAENIGKLTFGKQATAGDNFKLADPTEHGVDTLGDLVTSGKKVIDFTSARWSGFGFQTSYAFAKNADKDQPNTRTWQLLASYENDFDGLGLAANALYSHNKVNEDSSRKVWGLSTGVSYAGLGFAVDYTNTKDGDYKTKAWELATTYQVSEPLDVYLTYTHIKPDSDIKTKAISVGSHYQVAQNVQTYVEYSTQKTDRKDRTNAYYAGLRVFF